MAWQARVSPEETRIFRRLPVDIAAPAECDNCGRLTTEGLWRGGGFLCPACRAEDDACGCGD